MTITRSLARYLSVALGPAWEIAWASPGGGAFRRPWARLSEATGTTSTPIGCRHAERRRSYSLMAFPISAVTDEAATIEATRVEALLLRALTQGVDPAMHKRGRGHPHRLPLWNYFGVPVGQPATERIGVARIVEAPTVSRRPDLGDDRAFVVVADLRLSWTESVAEPITGPLVQRVSATAGG